MATIDFVNNTLITGTTFNPGLEDVLLVNGTISQHAASVFEITNNSGGAFNGFKFLLTSTAANFTYNGTTPTAGTIGSVTVLAPNGTTHIINATAGANGFGDASLVNFFNTLKSQFGGVDDALDRLFNNSDVVNGDGVADHLTAFGFGNDVLSGNNGDDTLTAEFTATLVGGNGNDIIRVGGDSGYVVAGANLDGSGGAGQTNTLEFRGDFDNAGRLSFDSITNIDAVRFVDTKPPVAPSVLAADLEIDLLPNQIGNGRVSLHLAVDGSTTASPHSQDSIEIQSDFDPTDTTPVNLDLSGWTFTHWNENRNGISIETNGAVALNDNIVGTRVADFIGTNAGNDTIRGGGGADFLNGDEGNDTFVYGLHEAVRGEEIFADGFGNDGGIDKVLVLADNNFTGVQLAGVEQLVFGGAATATFDQNFILPGVLGIEGVVLDTGTPTIVGDGHANTLAFVVQNDGSSKEIDLSDVIFKSWSNGTDQVTITGTRAHDDISGSTQNDVIFGAGGNDNLQGNQGADAFVFKTAFGHGVAHVADFTQGEDMVELDNAVFTKLELGELGKKEFGFGTHATKAKQHIVFDKDTGILRYDDDGKGGHHAHIVAVLDDVSNLTHDDLLVI